MLALGFAGAAVLAAGVALLVAGGKGSMEREGTVRVYSVEEGRLVEREPVRLNDAEWRRRLGPQRYRVLRGRGTERACSGALWKEHRPGLYRCAGCGLALFRSVDRFESGTGWPSFLRPVHPANIATRTDTSHGMVRTEIHCPLCGGHLGHVFPDGPPPTGLRYCVNSAALTFEPGGAGGGR